MTHKQVIALWQTHRELATLLGVSRPLVTQMYARDHIPSKYWSIICAARPQVSLEELAEYVRADRIEGGK